MAILKNRIRIRNNALEFLKFIVLLFAKFSTTLLLIFSCYLLYFSAPKPISNITLELTGKALEKGSLVYNEIINSFKWIDSRLSYFKDLETENIRLRLQVIELQKKQHKLSDVQSDNKYLRKILNVTKGIKKDFVTTKIVSMSSGPFARSAILQAGYKDNVQIDNIVRGNLGLIGRISQVSENYSIVTLINDPNSRIPIITNVSKTRGILAKQDDDLKIIHLKENHNISVGEKIYTSGDGRIFPKNIPIANVVKVIDNTAFVEIIENFNLIEFVIIESNSLNELK